MIGIGHRAASRTARRQRQCGNLRADTGSGGQHTPLSPRPCRRTSATVDTPEIFDRSLRRLRRDRAARNYEPFLRDAMVEGISERLSVVTRTFSDVLDLGSANASVNVPNARIVRCDAGAAFGHGGVQADEDRLPFADASFDLVVSAGVLDSVNDLPGALSLIRRVLRPDGLFLGAFLGAGTLSTLRAAFREAEPGVTRLHPQVDVRSTGDLLVRAGFALPVADTETLSVRYGTIFSLLADLRATANTNLLRDRTPLTRATLAATADAFARHADPDGRVPEKFEMVFLTGWAPDASQPRPARRGSATASLAAALESDKRLEQPD